MNILIQNISFLYSELSTDAGVYARLLQEVKVDYLITNDNNAITGTYTKNADFDINKLSVLQLTQEIEKSVKDIIRE